MKEIIANRINKLFSVKSIVTILLSVVFSALALRGTITGEQFLTIFSVIIAFYFGTQSARGADNGNG